MDIINSNKACNILNKSVGNRQILSCKKLLRTTVRIFLGCNHNGIKSCYCIAICIAPVIEFLYILSCSFTVILRLLANRSDLLLSFLIEFPLINEVKKKIIVSNKVQITVLFPLSVHVCSLFIITIVFKDIICSKNKVSVQHGIDHYHYNRNNNNR